MIPIDVIDMMSIKTDYGREIGVLECGYTRMTECHNYAIKEAAKENAALIFVAPDCLFSNQTMKVVYQNASDKIRLIALLGISLRKDDIVPLFEHLFMDENILANGLDSRTLVRLAIRTYPTKFLSRV